MVNCKDIDELTGGGFEAPLFLRLLNIETGQLEDFPVKMAMVDWDGHKMKIVLLGEKSMNAQVQKGISGMAVRGDRHA